LERWREGGEGETTSVFKDVKSTRSSARRTIVGGWRWMVIVIVVEWFGDCGEEGKMD